MEEFQKESPLSRGSFSGSILFVFEGVYLTYHWYVTHQIFCSPGFLLHETRCVSFSFTCDTNTLGKGRRINSAIPKNHAKYRSLRL